MAFEILKKYSKENFDKVKGIEEDLERIVKDMKEDGLGPLSSVGFLLTKYFLYADKIIVKTIYGKGQQEAQKLSEEYDALKGKVSQDMELLKRFEIEKLGMQKNDGEKKEE